MAESGTAGNPVVDAGTQVGTPVATMGFGARESADETRQAQQSVSNDAPTDVNMNAIIAREQGSTLTMMGKNFEANAMRFNGILNHLAGLLVKDAGKA